MANLFQAAAGISRMESLALGDSPIHRLHPMPKLIVSLLYIVAVVSFPSYRISGLMPFVFYPAVLMPLSGTPFRPVLARLLVALPFSLMAGLSNVLFVRETAFTLGTLRISFGMISLVSLPLKTALTVLAVLILIAVTPLGDITGQLLALKVPKVFCLSLMMTYRYLSALLGEGAMTVTAYRLRAPGQKGIHMRHMGGLAGQLVLRGFERAERVYQAMKCRGFQNEIHVKRRRNMQPSDWAYAGLLTMALAVLRFLDFTLLWSGWAG